MAIYIRPATSSDINIILKFIFQLAAFEEKFPGQTVVTKENIQRYCFGEAKCFDCDLAFSNHQAAGCALYSNRFAASYGLPVLYIENLIVVQEFRNQGIGKAMMMKLIDTAKQRNCVFMEWLVYGWNHRAHAFYDRLGAQNHRDLVVYRFPLENKNYLQSQVLDINAMDTIPDCYRENIIH